MTTLKTEIPPESSQLPRNVSKIDVNQSTSTYFLRSLQLRTKNLSIYRGPYEDFHKYLRYFQIVFGALGLLHFAWMFIYMEKEIDWNTGKSAKRVALFGLEFVVWSIAAHFLLRWKNMPANFPCFLLQRCFVYLEDTAFSQKDQFRPIMPKKILTKPEVYFNKTLTNVALMAGYSFAFLSLMMLTKVDVSQCDSLCLVGCVVATTWTTIVLLSAMAIEHIGKDNHILMCELWVYLCAIVTLFVLLHLFQRLCNRICQGNFAVSHQPRAMMEIFIFTFVLCFGIGYIQDIHREFSVHELLTEVEINKRLKNCIPRSLTSGSLHAFEMAISNYLGSPIYNIFAALFGENTLDVKMSKPYKGSATGNTVVLR